MDEQHAIAVRAPDAAGPLLHNILDVGPWQEEDLLGQKARPANGCMCIFCTQVSLCFLLVAVFMILQACGVGLPFLPRGSSSSAGFHIGSYLRWLGVGRGTFHLPEFIGLSCSLLPSMAGSLSQSWRFLICSF